MNFKNVKKQILESADLSRKGSADAPIVDLLNLINKQPDYVTTSSCSGRAILFTSVRSSTLDGHRKSKNECQWLFTSHEIFVAEDFLPKVNPIDGDLWFKFEPFILHVQCSSLGTAQKLHVVAIAAGFRESGITVGKHGKITLAIRSNIRLEVPLSQDGVMLVSDIYLKFLVEQANKKLEKNLLKINVFSVVLKDLFKNCSVEQTTTEESNVSVE